MFKGNVNKLSYLLIFSGGGTLILIILYFLLGKPVFIYTDKMKAEFKVKQAILEESQELIRSLPNPQKAIGELKNKVQEFKDMGLTKKQLPRLTQILGQAASERKISVLSIKPRDDTQANSENLPEGVTKVYIELVLVSNYKALADYVKSLADLPIAFTVESLSFARRDSEENKAALKGAASRVEIQSILLVSTYMVWEL